MNNVKYKIKLTDNKMGKVKIVTEEFEDGILLNQEQVIETIKYLWEDGNMSCDCNKAIYFGFKNYNCGENRFKADLLINNE